MSEAAPPRTEEGWYVLHDFRTVDWDAWREAPEHRREAIVEAGEHYLRHRELVADSEAGASASFAVLGHEADLLLLHLRPTLDALERVERRLETTALGAVTEQTDSFVSVTEVSDYVSDAYFEDREEMDTGTRRYMENKLQPDIPAGEYVSFYPMAKRRQPEQNWYELSHETRGELMAEHGDTGRDYAGDITQIVSSSVGLDDWEWGVTLFGADPTDIKDIVYEMRFDEVSARYGEFGRFRVGRRFPPGDLGAYLRGEGVPTGDADGETEGSDATDGHASDDDQGHDHEGEHGHEAGHDDGDDADADAETETETETGATGGGPPEGVTTAGGEGDIREALDDLDIYAGQPRGEDVYALVLYSRADAESLTDEVFGLRGNFDHYDTHVKTAVYETIADEPAAADARHAVVSLWETQSAADTASGFLQDLPGVVGRPDDTGDGWGTMGMFYTTKPEHTDDFVETFDEVGAVLADMDGHRGTDLLRNVENADDMFIASRWTDRESAMAFFRSEAFSETVSWGREVLADRPRHVFLA